MDDVDDEDDDVADGKVFNDNRAMPASNDLVSSDNDNDDERARGNALLLPLLLLLLL